jgi:PAS domain S-box-containing protein
MPVALRAEAGRSRRATFVSLVAVIIAGTVAATTYTQWRLRAEAVDRQLDAATMYARNFADHLTLSLDVLDITMSHITGESREFGHYADALRAAPYLRSLSLLDDGGRFIAASSNQRNIGTRIDQKSFLPAAAGPLDVLRVGPPWVGRDFHAGRPASALQPVSPDATGFIAVLRKVSHDDQRWNTLVAAINPGYFLNHYSKGIDSGSGVVELLRYDGMLLLSTDESRQPGSHAGSERIVGQIERQESGQHMELQADGRTALLAYRASRNYPFIVVVRLDKERALAAWREEARRTALIVFLALLAALTMATLYYRRLERIAQDSEAVEAELKLRGAALGAAANAIVITDRDGDVKWANPAFGQLSGYALDETLGRNLRELLKSGRHPQEFYAEMWNTILAGKVWQGEIINRRKDGSLFHEDQTITPVRDAGGEIREFIAVKQDITQRKASEARMEELSRHLVTLQEGSRRRLSGELHDRTSPNLAAIRINLDILAAALPADQASDLHARLEDTRALIEDTAASIREICSDLRPAVLDYAGLAAALDSYAHQFSRRTGIAVQIDCHGCGTRLPPDLETVFFRVAQEALTNCAKHARAERVDLSLRQSGPKVVLDVTDDGVGFATSRLGTSEQGGGLGIVIMRELVEFSGGSFVLESRPGYGTHIHVEIETGEMQK